MTAVTVRLGAATVDVRCRPLVVAVLNRTRDSFHDGGRHLRLDALLRRAEQLVQQGADVLEVGARPGGVGVQPVTPSQEADLAASALAALRDRFDVALAVDTTRAEVAAAAYAAGAVLGNDMSGFRDDAYLAEAVRAGASVIATHCRLPPGVPDPDPQYDDVACDVVRAVSSLAERAVAAGLPHEAVVVDPGLDLGKTWQQSVSLLSAVDAVAALGHPVLLAASHKIFLGRLLHLETEDLATATAIACTVGALRGARLLRVHDAAVGRQVATVVEAVLAADRTR